MPAVADVGFVPDAPDADLGFVPDKPDDLGFVPDKPATDYHLDPMALQAAGVNQPSQVSSGLPPSTNPADNPDWDLTRAVGSEVAPVVDEALHNKFTKGLGSSLDTTGKLLSTGFKAGMEAATGNPDLAKQEFKSTLDALQGPAFGEEPTESPYDEARKRLPLIPRAAAGAGMGLVESAPRLALAAVQPEVGAASFGFTPDGFDPVTAATMMIAPGGGKLIGGIADKLALKAGITSDASRALISKVGGATGIASIMSAPSVYQISQMKPGPERDAAFEDTASNFLLVHMLAMTAEHAPKPNDVGFVPDETSESVVQKDNGEGRATPVTATGESEMPGSRPATPFQTPADEVVGQIQKNVVPPAAAETTPTSLSVAQKVDQPVVEPNAPATKQDVIDLHKSIADLRDSLANPFKTQKTETTPENQPVISENAPEVKQGVAASPLEQVRMNPVDAHEFAQWSRGKTVSELRQLRDDHETNPMDKSDHAIEIINQIIAEKSKSASLKFIPDRQSEPLTPGAENATTESAAPVTSTVRSADELGNERQRGRVPGNPGMTAESGSNPDLGAAAFQNGQRVTVALRPGGKEHFARIVQMQPDGSAQVKLDRENSYRQIPSGQIFKTKTQSAREAKANEIAGLPEIQRGQTKADAEEFARLFKEHGAHPDVGWFHPDATMQSATKGQGVENSSHLESGVRNAMRDLGMPDADTRSQVDRAKALPRLREFLEKKGIAAVDPKKQKLFIKDIGQKSKGTEPLTMDDLREGAEFSLKGAKFVVRKLHCDEDGRITHIILDDGKIYGTQEFFGERPLRMDKGSLVATPADTSFAETSINPGGAQEDLPPDLQAISKHNNSPEAFRAKAEQYAQQLESLKAKTGGRTYSALFPGLDPTTAKLLWNAAVSVAQKVVRAGGSIADAINAAIKHIRDNHKGQFDEQGARAKLNESVRDEAMDRGAPQPERWQDIAAKVDEAQQNLKDRIAEVSNRPAGTSKEDAKKASNIAAATYRNLRDRLLKSPDYAEHLLTQEKEAHRQLTALAQKAGIERVGPDGLYGHEDKLQAALTPAEIERVRELDNQWQQTRQEIDNLPKKNINAAYNRLYPEEVKGGTGAARADVPSDWLKAKLGENPKVDDLEDITTAGDKIKNAIETLPDNAREAYKGAVNFTRQLKAKFTTLPNRDELSKGKDAADNKATIFSKQVGNVVLHELNRAFGVDRETRNPLREQALTVAIEAGDRGTLKLMRDTIDESPHRFDKWAKVAKSAIDYAEKHWERFDPVRDLYKRITDAQVASENASGIKTLHREGGYVFHLQDVMEGWAHLDMAENGVGAASPFKQIRDHATYADAIAAGVSPKTLNAVDLLQRRIALGQKLINYRAWQDGLKHLTDPTTQLPLAADVQTRMRADGTSTDTAPSGYKIVQFAGQKLAIHKGYTGLFEALTGESFFRKNEAGAIMMKAMTTAKHTMLLFDTFHLGRLAYWNAITRGFGDGALSLLPGNPFSHKGGLTLLDSTVSDIRKMGETGEIPKEVADRLIAQRKTLDLLVNEGLNVGGVGDNTYSDWVQKLPIAGTFNRWLFEKFQRGAMAEIGLIEFDRQSSLRQMNSLNLTGQQIARQVAKAINVRFGNLNSQSWIKSKSFQDLARIAFLAPQWNESLIRSEIGAVHDVGAFAKGAIKGKLVVGTLGRAVATAFIGQFIANQLINYYTRGKPTWDNPEESMDAKLSAWIPDKVGSSSGFFINPLTLPAEMSHLILKGYERTGRLDKAALEAVTSRFSSLGRFAETLYTGHNREGEVANTTSQRLWMAAKEAAPTPISGSAIVRAGKQMVTGRPEEQYPGQFQRQAMQTFGIKPDSAPSPEQRIYNLARKFNQAQGIPDREQSYHQPYANLDNAIRVGNMVAAKQELEKLLETHEPITIERRYQARTTGRFTGKSDRERDFVATLTPEEQDQYNKAVAERQRIAGVVSNLLQQK